MKRALFLAIVAIALSAPVLATAVGPLDGAYSVTETSSEGRFLDYVVVLQKEAAQVAIAILLPDVETWFYGIGTLSGSTASGTLFVPDGTSFGRFALRFGADGSLSGTLDTGETVDLNGSRLF